jgi:geranylgeranyl diphosphate synthase, type I
MVLHEFYEQYWSQIENRLINILNQGNPHPSVREIVVYHFKNPGKRLRSYLSTSLTFSFNSFISESDLNFAASVELLHNASLIHDDLEDQDFYRRGMLNVWKKFSPVQAINTGDLLFIKSIEILLSSGIPESIKIQLIQRTIAAINELIHGQMLEISFQNTTSMTRDNWEDIAAQKTGALMRLIFEGVFLLSGIDINTYQNELNSLGRSIGILYQTRDDLLDAIGLKEGRQRGSDILEGKMTCLSIKAKEMGDDKARLVSETLLAAGQTEHESRISCMIRLYEDQGIIDDVQNYFNDLIEQCRNHPIIKKFPHIKPVIDNFLDLLIIDKRK